MIRGIVLASIAVAVLLAAAVVPASATTVPYVLTWTDDQGTTRTDDDYSYGIRVKQEYDAMGGNWRYLYTVEANGTDPDPGYEWVDQMGFDLPGDSYLTSVVVELGFLEPLDGGAIVVGPYDSPLGLDWTVSGDAGTAPMPVWTADSDAEGIPYPSAADNMGYISGGQPDHMYNAYVIVKWDSDDDGTNDTTTTLTGKISGPTPEPCTLGLLGLSGLAMIRFFKRKRE